MPDLKIEMTLDAENIPRYQKLIKKYPNENPLVIENGEVISGMSDDEWLMKMVASKILTREIEECELLIAKQEAMNLVKQAQSEKPAIDVSLKVTLPDGTVLES